MNRIFNSLDTIIVVLLICFLVGGSSSAVKSFSDLDRKAIKETFFYRELINNNQSNSEILTIKPSYVILDQESKSFYDNSGKTLTNIEVDQIQMATSPKVFIKGTKYDINQQPKLNELIPSPLSPEQTNLLYYAKYNIKANIVYSKKSDYDIIDTGKPCSQKSMNTPIQKLVKQGIVHIYGSPLPGEVRYSKDPVEYYGKNSKDQDIFGSGIGSSYIVGHSSECTVHAYTKIFEPLQQRTEIGEEFLIWDQLGRKLNFKVFEVLEIDDNDTTNAYKTYSNRRVVTLQTSIYYNPYKIHRWLTRGELVIN